LPAEIRFLFKKHRFHILHFPNSTGLFTKPTGRHYTKYRFSPDIAARGQKQHLAGRPLEAAVKRKAVATRARVLPSDRIDEYLTTTSLDAFLSESSRGGRICSASCIITVALCRYTVT